MLGPYKVGLVGMDGISWMWFPLARLGTVRIQQTVFPNTENKLYVNKKP
jgi:hypothetical protein